MTRGDMNLWGLTRPSLDADWNSTANLGSTINSPWPDLFPCHAGRFIAIISFQIRVYANSALRQIGFVFSTSLTADERRLTRFLISAIYILYSVFCILCSVFTYSTNGEPKRRVYSEKISVRRRPLLVSRISYVVLHAADLPREITS